MSITIVEQMEQMVELSDASAAVLRGDSADYLPYEQAARAGVDLARVLVETQKRLDAAIGALERIEGNWQQVKSIKGNLAYGHEPAFLTVIVSKGDGE